LEKDDGKAHPERVMVMCSLHKGMKELSNHGILTFWDGIPSKRKGWFQGCGAGLCLQYLMNEEVRMVGAEQVWGPY
jgi:hypothetical protein